MRQMLILAGEEFREGLRNRWVLSTVLLLAALAFALALLGSAPIGETRVSPLGVTTVSLASLTVYLVPLIALTLSHDAIVGERERGTLLLLLSYPVSRWQVLWGKFFGHLAIILVAVVMGYGSTGLYIALSTGSVAADWALFVSMVGSSLVLGSVFIALGYLISVSVSSRATAAGVAIATWLFIVVVYDLLLLGVLLTGAGTRVSSDLFGMLMLLNPADIYRLFNLAGTEAASLVSGSLGSFEGTFLTPGILLAGLFIWVALPMAGSLWIFKRHEL
ncbi:MAG: ABC transporter permease subunit [Haliea sp.]|jgi:Cu-processing system permease protein|nr:ABC transporter permease subunit [Haliea sp.]